MDFPENEVIALEGASVSVVGDRLAYSMLNRPAIEVNWRRETEANPALYNGPVFLSPAVRISGGVLEGAYARTDFATLMYWRSDSSHQRPWHVFGVGVVVSSDNRLIAARMAARTALPGRVYFPAGSVDESDVVGGMVDYDASMAREVREETGLDLGCGRREQVLHMVTARRSVALFRRFRFPLPAEQLVAHVRNHIGAQRQPELDDAVVISGVGEMNDNTPSYVRTFADWHFRHW
jgi:8-oxo-dGTP pyrophosphatase MutT (NUDIX family)